MAGVSRLQYSNEIRLIRVMCSGRVDMEFIFRAFSIGMDGVFIGGCRLNECNYSTHGNHHALNMVLLCKKIMEYIGLNLERLRIAFMTSGEGNIFAEVVTDFSKKVKEIGPLGTSEGIDENELQLKLKAVRDIIPYIKLVERESLRIRFNTEEEYYKYYDSEEADRLFKEFIVDKLAISEIMLLLHEKPLSTGEIAEVLDLNPSEVSRYLNSSARQGLVRFDEDKKRYAPVTV